MAKTVVILGGAYAGVHVAHYLLKKSDKDVKVILVSKDTHFFWNMATVRAIVPGIIKDDEIFAPLENAFKRYPQDSWELMIGKAERADFDAKTVEVKETSTGASRTLTYDQLVLATGSRCASTDVPWKMLESHEETVQLLHATAEKVKSASHIVVAGAGATGVETAGELGFEYGKTKEIVLLSGGDAILGGDIVAGNAASELRKLDVKIQTGARVEDVRRLDDGRTEIKLRGGDAIVTDLYLPTMGLTPNSEYVDARYLTDRKTVDVDECLRVKGAQDVWAAGDIVSRPRAGFMITQNQAAGVAKNVEAALKGKAPSAVKGMPIDILACSVGRSRGAGRMGSIKMFSVMVHMAKGKTLGTERMAGYIDGSVA